MNAINHWIVFIFLAFITVLMVNKGLDLWSLGTNVDGDGIGIRFLGLEISDRVQEGNIPTYAIGFFVASFITLLFAFSLVGKTFLKLKRNNTACN
jgi:heme/copper-type cytochrome/quinol oxidase subunit 4